MNYKRSIVGSTIAFLLATSCCWLPFFIITLGGAASLASVTEGLEKFSGLFMLMGVGFLIFGGYQFFFRNKEQ